MSPKTEGRFVGVIPRALRPGNTGNIFLQLARNVVALQVEKRCCTYYHPPQTLSRKVEAACCIKLNWRLLFFQQIFSTFNNKFCCVTMFEVGGNTANNAFQLAMQQCCVARCSNLLLVSLHL